MHGLERQKVHRFKSWHVSKKNMSYMWNKNNTTTNPSVPELNYLKLSEVRNQKLLWHIRQECRTRDPGGPSSNPGTGKNRISLTGPIQNNATTDALCTRVEYLKLSEVKTRSHLGTLIESRTRDPEFPRLNHSTGKKKISHRSNENNTTTNPAVSELYT